MSRGSILLRGAEPTIEEGLVFARYFDTAADGFMRFLLGRRAYPILAEAYVRPDNEYSFRHVVFAEDGGSIVGMAAGWTAEQRREFSDRPLQRTARLAVMRILLAPLFRILRTIPDGSFYLLALAVDDGMRGRGVGSSLIDHIEQRARQSGSSRLCLDVSAKNDGAQRLYERRGMVAESRWPKSRLVPPLLLRLAIEL